MRRPVLALILLVLLAPWSPTSAQEGQVRRWFEEINRDIWRPFMEGVQKDDESLYLRVRSKDYVRVQANGPLILTYADYVDDTVAMMRRYREQGVRLTIDVRFEERIIDGASASEKGISRVLFVARDGEMRTYYARFHTISRKEGETWRVLTEYFSSRAKNSAVRSFATQRRWTTSPTSAAI